MVSWQPQLIACWRVREGRDEEAAMERVQLAPVDRVEILSLMDNSVDVLMAGTAVAKRAKRGEHPFARPQLRAEHGVSMLVTVERAGQRDTMLFDVGVSPDGVLHNLEVLERRLDD